MSKRARYSSVDGPTRLRRATSVAERVGALPPHLLRAPRRNLFFPAEFILTMPVLADDSLERARYHALLEEARRCRACVGVVPFWPARAFSYRRAHPCSRPHRVIARPWAGLATETFYAADAVSRRPRALCSPGLGEHGVA